MGPMQSSVRDVESALGFYMRDLDVLSEEQILGTAGGSARRPVDFTYEVASINQRVAMRLRGEVPPPAPEWTGWSVAPTEYQSKAAIAEYMRSTGDELIAAAKSVPEEEAGKMVGTEGNERPAHALASFAAMHTMYHDAQLNFIQSLQGDLEMHWF
jgi:DinB family protein